MDPNPPMDRFQQGLALAGGAAFGYLAMLDWVGLWFHHPWQRFPWMLAGALTLWAIFLAMGRDGTISRPTRRAFWWALLGLLAAYGIQLVYLLTRQGLVVPSLLLPVGTMVDAIKLAAVAGTGEGWGLFRDTVFTPALPAIWCLVGLLGLLLALAFRALAYHLDAGLRDPGDLDAIARAQGFVQRQRALAMLAALLALGLVLLQRFDPRQLDFAEGLALSWAQQHLAIFGFLAGYITEHRRLAAERRMEGLRTLPGSPLPL